jgi:hypothetical protein
MLEALWEIREERIASLGQRSLDAEFRELIYRARQHRFFPTHNNGSLYKFMVLGHDLDQLLDTQVFSRYMLPVRIFARPNRVLRFQSSALQ